MDELNFKLLKEYFIKNDDYIHPSIIRKKTKNGHYGMFASENIESDTIFYKNFNLNIDYNFVEEGAEIEKKIISLIIELNKGEQSDFYKSFQLLPSKEDVNKYSIFYCSKDMLEKLKSIGFDYGSILNQYDNIYKKIIEINNKYKYIDNLSISDIKYSMYIYTRYSWNGNFWYDPISQLFNHKNGNCERIYNEKDGCYYLKTNSYINKGDEIYISYGHSNSENLAFFYDFVDENDFNINLSIHFQAKNPIDFYKARLLMDIKEKFISHYKDDTLIVMDNGLLNINGDSIIINKNNLNNLFEVSRILSIENINDINNQKDIFIYKKAQEILKMNLNSINFEKYKSMPEIKIQYPYIGILIEKKYELLNYLIDHIDGLLKELIK